MNMAETRAAVMMMAVCMVLFGCGERLSFLAASVNVIFELSFQKISDFLAVHKHASRIKTIGKDDHWFPTVFAISAKGEKRSFVDFGVARLADGVACHCGERLTQPNPYRKNFLLFHEKRISTHFLLFD